jgi:hypothetical protein
MPFARASTGGKPPTSSSVSHPGSRPLVTPTLDYCCQIVARLAAPQDDGRAAGRAFPLVSAEAVGFEPTRRQNRLPVFKTGAFNRTRPHLLRPQV